MGILMNTLEKIVASMIEASLPESQMEEILSNFIDAAKQHEIGFWVEDNGTVHELDPNTYHLDYIYDHKEELAQRYPNLKNI